MADAKPGGSTAQGLDAERAIQEEIADLPASLRAPIVLCALEGLSYDAAARQLGVREPTLRGRLHRARRRLATRLRKRGIASPLVVGAVEPFRIRMPALPAALVQSTVQHSAWWSSVSGLTGGECAIPASIAALARGVLRSMLINTCKLLGIVALLAAGMLGTVLSAQQGRRPATAAPARPTARTQDQPAASATRPLPPQFQALIAQHEEHQQRIRTLKCVIEERTSIDGGQAWKDLVTWKVWKSGPRERVHSTMHRTLNPNGTFIALKAPGARGMCCLPPTASGRWRATIRLIPPRSR